MSRYVKEFLVAGPALLFCIPFLAILGVWRTLQLVWRKLDTVLLVAGIGGLAYLLYTYYQEVIN